MTVIVTGAAGFVGRHVLSALTAAGERQLVAVDLAPRPVGLPDGITYRQLDLREPRALLADAGPGAVLVHLAWDTARTPAFAAHAAHVTMLAGLLDAAGPGGLSRMVVLGSAAEFGNRGGTLAESDAPVAPLTPYGWGKAAALSLCRQWQAATGVPVLWLRPFVVYGPGQTGSMAIPHALECIRRGCPAQFTDGQQARDFLHVSDLAQAIVAAVRRPLAGMHCFNLGCGQPVRLVDFLQALAALAGSRADFDFGARPRRPDEPAVQIADVQAARRDLKWTAAVHWRDGVRTLLADTGVHL